MCSGEETHHRFVKTTPKPSATKKSKGELVGPPPPELAADVVAAGAGIAVLELVVTVGLAIFAIGRGCCSIFRNWTWVVRQMIQVSRGEVECLP